jgi:phosphoglycolate phosphatase
MHKKKLLIFDFDGTIADTLQVVVRIVNEIGPEFGLPPVSSDEFIGLKNKSVGELLDLANISWTQLPLVIKRARDRFTHHMDAVSPIATMPEVLRAIHEKGYMTGILTSNTKENVKEFIRVHDIEVFTFVRAPRSLFGKSRAIKDILKYNGFDPKDAVMIGDEVRDVEAAQKAKIDSIAVSWGFNSVELLSKAGPTKLIQQPHSLLDLMKIPPLDGLKTLGSSGPEKLDT